ncbi:hypothetical protein M5X06_00135 [Paenibacillus alvei]|uniref:Uncharacterized protein n=1 Tax=Paenibacillus alvei TaxID=44250 RepID=A0ABT4GW21_PAEAL|nr:hypothetical protein [Paenibacillus alvei]MCY9760629.1 hypothetical protein [Paenibacillus alvei]MCY9765243.1 hypothetical protein [Paenibacillus alvei]NEZ44374.1 hypothetical protein [Paenibacillus alvei]
MVSYKYVRWAREKWDDLTTPRGHDLAPIVFLWITTFVVLGSFILVSKLSEANVDLDSLVLLFIFLTCYPVIGLFMELLGSKLYPKWFLDRHILKLRLGAYIYPEWVFENVSYYIYHRSIWWIYNGNDLTDNERNFLNEINNQCKAFKRDPKDYRQFLRENQKALIECLSIYKKRFAS